jgi:hypothetical protein
MSIGPAGKALAIALACLAMGGCGAPASDTTEGAGHSTPMRSIWVFGDLSTVGSTLLINGRPVAVLEARRDSTLWDFNIKRSRRHLAEYQSWISYRDAAGLGTADEFRLSGGMVGIMAEYHRVIVDPDGCDHTERLGPGWVKMQLDSVMVHEQFLGVLPRFKRSTVSLVGANGDTLSVSIRPYKYPAITASFLQHRIEANSFEE